MTRGPESSRHLFLLLAGLCIFAFAPALKAELFWDDFGVIRADGPIAREGAITQLLGGRRVLFPTEQYPYVRPVVELLLMVEYRLAGTNPFAFHLTSLALQVANAMLALALLLRVPGMRQWAAFAGAALFALHPFQVESVLWVAARPAMLALFFAQLALLATLEAVLVAGIRRALLTVSAWL